MSTDYHSADRYDNNGWIVKPKKRVVIKKNPENGFFEVIDTQTGDRVGNSQTDLAARIIRRKYEARGCK